MFGIVKDAVKIIVGTGLGYSCKDWKRGKIRSITIGLSRLGYSCKDWKPDTIIPHEVSERPLRIFL